MGDNVSEGIYIGVCIFVFIVALSATITMFYMINNYAELSYEYGKNVENSSLIENASSTITYREVTGNQLISYYFNHIRKQNNSSNVYAYNIKILDKNDINIFEKSDFKGTYAEVLKIVEPASKYFLNYISSKEELNKIAIEITIKKMS